MKWTTVVKSLGIILCFIQQYAITKDYLSFKVITKVYIEHAKRVKLPGITICLPIYYLWSPDVLQRLSHRIPVPQSKDFFEFIQTPEGILKMKWLLTTMTIGEIKSTLGNHNKRMLLPLHIIDPLTGELSETKAEDFDKEDFLIDGMLCQMTFPKNPSLYTYDVWSVRQARPSCDMAVFEVNEKVTGHFVRALITFTPPGKFPFVPLSGFVEIAQDDNRYFFPMNYKTSKVYRLPPPYVTNCKDYNHGDFQSDDQLFQDCLNNFAAEKWNTSAPGTLVHLHTTPDLMYESLNLTNENRVEWNSVLNTCTNLAAQKACKKEHYTITSVEKTRMFKNSSYISILLPHEPIIITKFDPQMTMMDFFVAFGSTLGYWLGFNIVSVFIDSVFCIQRIQGVLSVEKFRPYSKSVLRPKSWAKRHQTKLSNFLN